MMKYILYKEWLKIKWYSLLAFIAMFGFTFYYLMRMNGVASIKGAGHLWEVMLQKEVIFLDPIKFIPLILGIGMAIVQFAPEMYHKSLKLTLHLPFSSIKLCYMMLAAGFTSLLANFTIVFISMDLVLDTLLAVELKSFILNTTLVWFTAGIAGYLLTSWITLEPSWKMRVFNLIVSMLFIRVFFLSNTPEAYNSFLPYLIIYTLLTASFSWVSIERFKKGKQ